MFTAGSTLLCGFEMLYNHLGRNHDSQNSTYLSTELASNEPLERSSISAAAAGAMQPEHSGNPRPEGPELKPEGAPRSPRELRCCGSFTTPLIDPWNSGVRQVRISEPAGAILAARHLKLFDLSLQVKPGADKPPWFQHREEPTQHQPAFRSRAAPGQAGNPP